MKTDRLTSGSAALDRLLGGGFELRTITQFYGGPASGKSPLCTIAAVSCLRAGGSVVFIDSEGFSIERFRQVAGSDTDVIADRLFLFEPVDFEQQGSMITRQTKSSGCTSPVCLSLTPHGTGPHRSRKGAGRHADAHPADAPVLGYAKRYQFSVLVTNQVYMDTMRNTFAGLGGTSRTHLKAIIRLIVSNTCWRRATLVKHRSRPEGAIFRFRDRAGRDPGKRVTPHPVRG